MKDLRPKILEAAVQVFMRYGVGRTRMGDIAKEAGLVRQTLYKVYPSKDDVLCATIRYYSGKSLEAVRQGWQDSESLGEKLDVYFEHAILASYAIVRASPDAADMIGGYSAAGKIAVIEAQSQKKTAIATILSPYEEQIGAAGLDVEQYADFIQTASIGLRDTAQNEQHLKSLLAALKANVILVATGTS